MSHTITDTTLTFLWENIGEPTDIIIVAVYNETANKIEISLPTIRSAESCSVTIPNDWIQDTVHAYGFARNENKEVSEAVYLRCI